MKELVIKKFEEVYGFKPTSLGRAPGRIEFVGNHTDYNLGTVIGSTIDKEIIVALGVVPDYRAHELSQDAIYIASGEFSNFEKIKLPIECQIKQTEQNLKWINYPLGIIKTYINNDYKVAQSFCMLIYSDLPAGAGLSSSAAIDLSVSSALIDLSKENVSLDLENYEDRKKIIKLGKESENTFVGIPCGILDQGVCGFGNESSLVHIDCRTLDISLIPFPKNVSLWIFNTHTRHSLINSLYSQRYDECMKAASILGVSTLSDINFDQLHSVVQHSLKDEPIILKRASHIIEEVERVRLIKNIFESSTDDSALKQVGTLLYNSHESSINNFENSTEHLNFLVSVLKEMPNVYGARLTGGGFGGAVMAMTTENFNELSSEEIKKLYKSKFGEELSVLRTNPGKGMQILSSN